MNPEEAHPLAGRVPDQARLVLATHNPGKLAELRDILAPLVPDLPPEAVVSAAALKAPEPVESGLTFADNALLKARALAADCGLPAVADDSGLCVDVLGGAPGIFSARWCGHHGDDTANLTLLLNQLRDIDDPHRTARFTCAAVLVAPGGAAGRPDQERVVTMERHLEGRLAHEPHGHNGFGYDPVFIPASEDALGGAGRTTAQMEPAEKNAVSHRGQAFRALAPVLAALLV
ncbi:RdgB/HAM1 family non-canonical purine NTP pyrophosphatase [Actinomyces wuliandei]|uniref:RdgB/HAM1 family non-canonical purine NTP pyrophosphatase n=1 Tax=Actinomyces wuliandei TaxID=2057743 RepID=UPI00111A0E26|nr:RdgB/HAM1 family non-canonical purine NTP pyrophosphatase [Actinomyces wuliandei]